MSETGTEIAPTIQPETPKLDLEPWPELVEQQKNFTITRKLFGEKEQMKGVHGVVVQRNQETRTDVENQINIAIFPGVLLTGEAGVGAGMALLSENPNVSQVVIFDSLASSHEPTSVDPLVNRRGMPRFAGATEDFIDQSTVKNTIFIGHSVGGKYIPEITSILAKESPQTLKNLKGIVFVNSGGIFNQDWRGFIARAGEVDPAEMETLFPNPLSIFRLKVAAREAKRRGDSDQALALNRLAEEYAERMKRNSSEENLLQTEDKKALEESNVDLAAQIPPDWEKNSLPLDLADVALIEDLPEVKALLKRRKQLLMPIEKRMAAGTEPPGKDRLSALVHLAGATTVRPDSVTHKNRSLSEQMPNVPIVIVMSEQDKFFPASLAKNNISLDTIEQMIHLQPHEPDIEKKHQASQVFPNASSVTYAHVGGAGHALLFTQPKRFGHIFSQIAEKVNFLAPENLNPKTMDLYY